MSHDLMILAGKTAYEQIRGNGLSPEDIDLVLGASGAAKWLSIYGLDSAIFAHWFKDRTAPLHLLGTSVGAWKFAAATQKNPETAFDRLRAAYIRQVYEGSITPDKVTKESRRVMDAFIPKDGIAHILSNPVFRVCVGAVRCKSIMASGLGPLQALSLWSGFGLNLMSRKLQRVWFERALFHHPRFDVHVARSNDFATHFVPLTPGNFMKALLASGSIPLVMNGVNAIPGAPKGVYRDGGLLDYHPAFALGKGYDGLILYPHFYPHIIPGWFDKKLPGRRAKGSALDRVVLLAPSKTFVAKLPFGRIPDRKDFIRLKGRDKERMAAWTKASAMSRALGEQFLEAAQTGRIREMVLPFSAN